MNMSFNLHPKPLWVGSCLVFGGAMYMMHCHNKNKRNNFIKCYDYQGNSYYVNPRSIRWIAETQKHKVKQYELCSRQNGCGPLDVLFVYKDQEDKMKDICNIK